MMSCIVHISLEELSERCVFEPPVYVFVNTAAPSTDRKSIREHHWEQLCIKMFN